VTPPTAASELTSIKSAGTPTLNADGTFDVQYGIEIENTGNLNVSALQLADNLSLATQLGAAFTPSDATVTTSGVLVAPAVAVVAGTPTLPTTDATYDGTGNLFLGTDGLLKPGDSIAISFSVRIDPYAAGAPSPLTNSATASGTGPDGAVSDITDSTSAADDSGGSDDPTSVAPPTPAPALTATKSAGVPTANADGTFDVQYTIEVANSGNVLMDNLQLADNLSLASQLGATFSPSDATTTTSGVITAPVVALVSGTPTLPTANGSYDGTANLLAGTDGLLNPGDVISITFSVRINPFVAGAPSPLTNSATASGDDPTGTTTSDVTDSSNTADDSGGSDDPTSVTPPVVASELSSFKTVSSFVGNADGTSDIVFSLDIVNTGDLNVSNIQLFDDLSAPTQFGAAIVPSDATVTISGILAAPSVTALAGTPTLPTANVLYDGTGNLLSGTDGLLKPGDSITIMFTVRVDPNATGAPSTLSNSGTASGSGPDGPVSDVTDSTHSGDDTGGDDDPTAFPPASTSAELTSIKNAGTPTLNPDGTMDVQYGIEIENTGTLNVSSLQLADNLSVATQLGVAFTPSDATVTTGGVLVAPAVAAVAGTPTLPTTNTTYDGTGNLFLGTDGLLKPGDRIAVSFTVRINPYAAGAPSPLTNSATASGTGPGGPVSDVTDSTSAADDTGGSDDPTSVTPPTAGSELTSIKNAGTPTLNTDGTMDVVYGIEIENTGTLNVSSLQLADDLSLATQLGTAISPSGRGRCVGNPDVTLHQCGL